MKKYIKVRLVPVIGVIAISVMLSACANGANAGRSTYIGSPTPAGQVFRSDKFYLSAQLPDGWAGVEGSELLALKTLWGAVAFNSWGQADFWVKAQTLNHSAADNPTPVISYTYSRETVASQIPDGGAYVALIEIEGPPTEPGTEPPEYTLNDLSGLINPHDWRQDASTSAQFFDFYKWGRRLQLEIACKVDASDDTVVALNDLLENWRFDEIPAGDPGWAVTVARRLLPAQVGPDKFNSQSGMLGDQTVARQTWVEVRQDKTVHFRFTYYWNIPAVLLPRRIDSPSDIYHWWEIDVGPDGQAVLSAQGGTPLLPADSSAAFSFSPNN